MVGNGHGGGHVNGGVGVGLDGGHGGVEMQMWKLDLVSSRWSMV